MPALIYGRLVKKKLKCLKYFLKDFKTGNVGLREAEEEGEMFEFFQAPARKAKLRNCRRAERKKRKSGGNKRAWLS